ncbi:MAG TPA: hypothetical protein VGH75_09030 [Steroidobacteraceae bacterium]
MLVPGCPGLAAAFAGAAAGRAGPDLEAVPAERAGGTGDRGAAAPPEVMGAVPDFTAEDPGWTPAADADVFG